MDKKLVDARNRLALQLSSLTVAMYSADAEDWNPEAPSWDRIKEGMELVNNTMAALETEMKARSYQYFNPEKK